MLSITIEVPLAKAKDRDYIRDHLQTNQMAMPDGVQSKREITVGFFERIAPPEGQKRRKGWTWVRVEYEEGEVTEAVEQQGGIE